MHDIDIDIDKVFPPIICNIVHYGITVRAPSVLSTQLLNFQMSRV